MSFIPALELIQTLSGHTDRVWGLAWSPSGKQLASCSGDRTVRIWSFHAGNDEESSRWQCDAVLEEEDHDRTIRSVDWSPDGRCLATASFDASTAIWHQEDSMWELVATLEGHENEVKGVAWSPNGTALATCGRDKAVWIWEVLPGNEFEVLDIKQGHSQDVKMVAWHPSGELLASASYDDSIKMWRDVGDEWECSQTLSGPGLGHSSTVWALSFSKDGRRMVSCGDDGRVKIWYDSRGKLGWKLEATLEGDQMRAIFSVSWSADDVIASASGDNSICLYSATSTQRKGSAASGSEGWQLLGKQEQAHEADVNCVRWSPDACLLASAGDDNEVKLWQ